MSQKQINSDKSKIEIVKGIYAKALSDINKIKRGRDKKIQALLKTIDNRHMSKILEDIKNTK
jgi:hypothetical protein